MSLNRPESRYQELASKWLDGTITNEERKEFSEWYNKNQDEDVSVTDAYASSELEHRDKILKRIKQNIGLYQEPRRISFLTSSIAAAIILLILSCGAYLFFKQNKIAKTSSEIAVVSDIPPGSDKATLTLEDGSILKLNEISDGSLKENKSVRILKKDGGLIYETLNKLEKPLAYNTITTPKGGQFRVILPDGSKVWLNSSSSLRYPVTFNGNQRTVKLTGEGYFEVAKYKSAGKFVSFKINVNDKQDVEVLGTHFNIMAYTNEKVIKTTLLEGSVRVLKPGTGKAGLLKPGEQSVYAEHTGFVIKKAVDTEESISWKNGLISFKDADIQSIMRQIERWYDVRVNYSGDIPRRVFTGGISRNSPLSSTLKILELNNIHFKVKDKTITVVP